MKVRDIYRLYFPYESTNGEQEGKMRPVLVFVLTSIKNRFIGLKITRSRRDFNRVKIKYCRESGLKYPSYVQCDYYSVIELQGETEYIGSLKQSDYDNVVLKFNEFYKILE